MVLIYTLKTVRLHSKTPRHDKHFGNLARYTINIQKSVAYEQVEKEIRKIISFIVTSKNKIKAPKYKPDQEGDTFLIVVFK
jgi:hypothetical protein